MAIDHAETAALWIDAANRLREVREAERRFLDLWEFERAEPIQSNDSEESLHDFSGDAPRVSIAARCPRYRQ